MFLQPSDDVSWISPSDRYRISSRYIRIFLVRSHSSRGTFFFSRTTFVSRFIDLSIAAKRGFPPPYYIFLTLFPPCVIENAGV